MNKDLDRFRNLTFEDFGRMAADPTLKPHERIGFPAAFREGFDEAILEDLKVKLPALNEPEMTIIDIGCGCGKLVELLIDNCRNKNQRLVLVDSQEVLDQIGDEPGVLKAPGKFPSNIEEVRKYQQADVILCYSVFHYVFDEGKFYEFIEKALTLLKPGGVFLIGDIPNVSKRNRFLNTHAGIAYHQKLMQTDTLPSVSNYSFEEGRIDDGIIAGIMARYRNFGFETYLLPQSDNLALANSREDILFKKY